MTMSPRIWYLSSNYLYAVARGMKYFDRRESKSLCLLVGSRARHLVVLARMPPNDLSRVGRWVDKLVRQIVAVRTRSDV